MRIRSRFVLLHIAALAIPCLIFPLAVMAQAVAPSGPTINTQHADHSKEQNKWFYRGRVVRGQSSAELRRRAYQTKLRMRADHAWNAHPQNSFRLARGFR